jgi:hypothetical protein
MPEELSVYRATLIDRFGKEETKRFTRFNDGIVWLAREFAAGDGNAVYGEIRQNAKLVWRRSALGFRAPESLHSTN